MTPEELATIRARAAEEWPRSGELAQANADRSALLAEVDRLRATVQRVRYLIENDYQTHWSVIDDADGEYAQEGDPCVSRDELRAALAGDGGGDHDV